MRAVKGKMGIPQRAHFSIGPLIGMCLKEKHSRIFLPLSLFNLSRTRLHNHEGEGFKQSDRKRKREREKTKESCQDEESTQSPEVVAWTRPVDRKRTSDRTPKMRRKNRKDDLAKGRKSLGDGKSAQLCRPFSGFTPQSALWSSCLCPSWPSSMENSHDDEFLALKWDTIVQDLVELAVPLWWLLPPTFHLGPVLAKPIA